MKAEICRLNEENICCDGFKWNEATKNCDKCPSGYNGQQCAYPCIYPYYGEDCLSNCNCTEEQCDFVFGCTANSTPMQGTVTSAQTAAKNFSEVGHIEGTTGARPTSRISTSPAPVSMVFYITIALISVCVVFLMIYFLKKYFLRKQRINSTLNVGVEEPVYSHYEEVKLTHI
uniref:Scavenger receptor class F member 1-like n=1 Tax=Crassostrea virginica TaxID=6565 RepID=A0A8B8AWS4_CRAVI|nr:scavenger receptor class F member 1-like [Crassostrea virginica]